MEAEISVPDDDVEVAAPPQESAAQPTSQAPVVAAGTPTSDEESPVLVGDTPTTGEDSPVIGADVTVHAQDSPALPKDAQSPPTEGHVTPTHHKAVPVASPVYVASSSDDPGPSVSGLQSTGPSQ
jgi:hypothetical protein